MKSIVAISICSITLFLSIDCYAQCPKSYPLVDTVLYTQRKDNLYGDNFYFMDSTLVKITRGFTNSLGHDFIDLRIKDKQLIVFHHLNMVVNTENGYETEFIKGCFVFENGEYIDGLDYLSGKKPYKEIALSVFRKVKKNHGKHLKATLIK